MEVTEASPADAARTGRELLDAAREALRHWAAVEDDRAEEAARDFLVLFCELRRDDKLARPQRDAMTIKVRGRLSKLATQIGKRAAIARRLAGRKGAQARPATVDAAQQALVLAQQGIAPGIGVGAGPAAAGMAAPGLGGMMGGGRFGGLNAAADYGQQLAELIQATIAPGSWDVNGGTGSIYYWQPGRALVIRASGDVHDDVGDALDQLRRAGQ
jgi:hypothetical protein